MIAELLTILIPILIMIESSGDPNAVGAHDDVGILQITPIYLMDVNRILGKEVYKLNDRYDPAKSKQMTRVYLTHYAPKICRDEAVSVLDRLLILGAIHHGGPKGYTKHAKHMTSYRIKISKYYNSTKGHL